MNKSNTVKLPFLAIVLLLSACRSPVNTVENNLPTKAEQEIKRVQQCQQELTVLSSIKSKDYTVTKQAFDRLMGNAAQYASLRNKVNGETQSTVDALYNYKISLLCAEINQAVLLHLAQQER
ncbi:hypothetical protein BHU62_21860 [Serratia marcescens]|uniref:Lipoprotein n=1 Tax=Serratia marcescens TaxID=615 RepID=A0A1Q4NUM7_SERMA|nr:hypothetical protein [Serratia marcescens]OKB64578.1 hypothetical protein BHU62_21860 [Serratia marcescens]